MAAVWQANEITAVKRRADVIVYLSDGVSLADRGTDLIGDGVVYFCGPTSPDYAVALGTMTNKRRPLVVADDTVESVDTGADTLTLTTHGYETGDGPFDCDELIGIDPDSIAIGADFWIIAVTANTIAIAESLADAYSDTRVALSGNETAAVISDNASTQRGLDGLFTYEATQTETDHDAPESSIIVEGASYTRSYTTVNMTDESASVWEQVMEGAHTYGDGMRGALSILAGESSGYDTGTIVFRDLADSKNRWTFTVNATGRLTAVANNLT
ncbi:MAG: hypothetical protein EHM89_00245 [Acidobacteria bacterium]|nr:MAG: hypothetical protein EHM89_00245 [Acidobacteriota bacterium]